MLELPLAVGSRDFFFFPPLGNQITVFAVCFSSSFLGQENFATKRMVSWSAKEEAVLVLVLE